MPIVELREAHRSFKEDAVIKIPAVDGALVLKHPIESSSLDVNRQYYLFVKSEDLELIIDLVDPHRVGVLRLEAPELVLILMAKSFKLVKVKLRVAGNYHAVPLFADQHAERGVKLLGFDYFMDVFVSHVNQVDFG